MISIPSLGLEWPVFTLVFFFFSCLALNDLIRGRQADEIVDRLSEIWETLFRVLDDIKVGNGRLWYVSLVCDVSFDSFDFFLIVGISSQGGRFDSENSQ